MMNEPSVTTETVGEILGEAGMTVLIGMVVVFLVLLLLTVIFKLFGAVMSRTAGGALSSRKETPSVDIRIPKVTPVAPLVARPAAPAVDDGIDEETVAAICAAIACVMPEGKPYRVRSIRAPRAGGRSAWSAAGVADATRPF